MLFYNWVWDSGEGRDLLHPMVTYTAEAQVLPADRQAAFSPVSSVQPE